MTLTEMRLRVAENINQLGSDGSTIAQGVVTSDGIDRRLNDIYREELFTLLSDRFPYDFARPTYPISTYTATGTVDATSTSTALVATSSIFNNTMEGFTVYNLTDDESAVISTYTSATTVTLDTTIGDTWDGDTIYVLGNEYTFGGDTTDAKELLQVSVKYVSTDSTFTVAKLRDYHEAIQSGSEEYSASHPIWYRTTVQIAGVSRRGFGILPFPTNYDGKLQFIYVEKPPVLTASDEPQLYVAGVSEVMIYGTSAWALRNLKQDGRSNVYQALYEKGKQELVTSYKPRSKSGPVQMRAGNYIKRLQGRWH